MIIDAIVSGKPVQIIWTDGSLESNTPGFITVLQELDRDLAGVVQVGPVTGPTWDRDFLSDPLALVHFLGYLGRVIRVDPDPADSLHPLPRGAIA